MLSVFPWLRKLAYLSNRVTYCQWCRAKIGSCTYSGKDVEWCLINDQLPLIRLKKKILCLKAQSEKVYFSRQGSQISHYFLCISLSQKSKFPSKWLNFLAMTLPKCPFFPTMSQSLREFFKPTRHAVFYFLFYFFYFNWPLPPRTSETKNDWKVSTSYFQKSNGILHVFWAPTCKLSSFFVVKMKKNNNFKKKKMKVWILQNQMRTEKQMRAAALRYRIFFF